MTSCVPSVFRFTTIATSTAVVAAALALSAPSADAQQKALKSYKSDTKEFWTNPPDDWFLGEEFYLVQYSTTDKFFSPIGDLQKFDGKTASITPENLITGG